MAPPGLSKRLPASAKQSTISRTAKPAAKIAQTLAGPSSAAAATGRMRYTPLPMTSLTESATISQRETARRKPGDWGEGEEELKLAGILDYAAARLTAS